MPDGWTRGRIDLRRSLLRAEAAIAEDFVPITHRSSRSALCISQPRARALQGQTRASLDRHRSALKQARQHVNPLLFDGD